MILIEDVIELYVEVVDVQLILTAMLSSPVSEVGMKDSRFAPMVLSWPSSAVPKDLVGTLAQVGPGSNTRGRRRR